MKDEPVEFLATMEGLAKKFGGERTAILLEEAKKNAADQLGLSNPDEDTNKEYKNLVEKILREQLES